MTTTSPKPTSVRASIEHFMTPNPHCIGHDQPLSKAHERMRTFQVRHLPVLERGKRPAPDRPASDEPRWLARRVLRPTG